jgi:hypothetical protein
MLLFTVCRGAQDVTVKEEVKSPVNPSASKHKLYSITDGAPIGCLNTTNLKLNFDLVLNGKRQKTTSVGSSQVRFDGVVLRDNAEPNPRVTRKSTMSAKASSKKSTHELFEWLGQEFWAVTKTCEDIAEALD